MIIEITSLLALPVETLAALGGGYLAYRLAFTGRNAGHRQVDTILLVLLFGLIVQVASGSMPESISQGFVAAVGISLACAVAAVWRAWLEPMMRQMWRSLGVSDHDGQPNVWRSALARAELNGPTRVLVTMKDGTAYMSDDLAQFSDAPMGPCLFGEDGSIALYITHTCGKDDDAWEEHTPRCEGYGDLMTFIAPDDIKLIEVQRHR